MAVLIQFNLFDFDDRSTVAKLLELAPNSPLANRSLLAGSSSVALPVEPAQVAITPAPAAAPPTHPAPPAACAAEPATEYTPDFMREQFRVVATKDGCREAAFTVLAKYGNGKRTLDAVDKSHYPAMLAEWQAIGVKA